MLKLFIIQLIGAIAYGLLCFSYFKKEKKQMLFVQIISYIFFGLHYFLLSGITGAICNFIGFLALLVIYLFEKYHLKNKLYVSFLFVIILIIANVITFQNIYSIFPLIASVIATLSFLIDDENIIRKIGAVSAMCWLIYAIVYKSYISIIFEIVTLIDVIIALFKNKKGR